MKGKRNIIRQFINSVGWVVPQNLAYLFEGDYYFKLYHKYQNELEEMTKTKHGALHKIYNKDDRAAFSLDKKHLTTFLYNHDVMLRNCMARFIFDRGYDEIDKVSIKRGKGNSDAHFENIHFEFDNGSEGTDELLKKIKRYGGKGHFQVVFIMRNMYNPALDIKRLEKLFEIIRKVMFKKPNRILGACYSEYLKNGKIFNLKGEEVNVS